MSNPGYLTATELTTVQGVIQLGNATARAFIAMRAAAKKDGVGITIAEPGGGYRSMALTLAMRKNPAKYNVTPGILPSLQSKHMQGIAADIGGGFAWVKAHGKAFGFTFPLKGDPNHSVYDGVTIPAGAGSLIKEKNMATNFVDTSTYKNKVAVAGTQCMTVWEGGPILVYSRTMVAGELATSLYELYGTHKPVPHDQFAAIRAAFEGNVSAGGGSTDLAPVLSAIAAIPTPPTAAEIASAVNTDAAARLAQ